MTIEPEGSQQRASDEQLRLRIVNSAIRITAFSAPFVSLLILISSYFNNELNLRTWMLCAFPLVFPILATVKKQFSLKARGTVFLGLMLLMGFMVLFRGGISIAQAALQLWVLLLAALIFGVRGVAITLVINLAGFAIAGYAVITGIVPPITETMWNPELPSVWIRGGTILALFGGSSAIAVAIIVTQLEQETQKLRDSLAREQNQRQALERAERDNRQARDALENAQRTEALGKMASGVAHDFNNSLTIIMGSAEIALLNSSKTEQVEKSLNSIIKASTKSAELTRSLLSFGRKEPAKKTAVELKTLIENLSSSMSRLLPDDVELHIAKAEPATILIDKAGIESALFNVIANANDAIDGKGEIILSSYCTSVTSEGTPIPAGNYAVISVSDNGKGIHHEMKPRIFEPYYTTKETGGGAGMGLALLRSLVTEAQGYIDLTSKVGQGTTISLFFPLAEVERSESPQPDNSISQIAKDNYAILLVEDNTEVLNTMIDTLTTAGFKVENAKDGNKAIEIIATGRHFDLLCIDGVIPGASSAEVIETYRDQYPGSPVLVCSGYIEEELVIRGINTGDLGYLRKPYRSQQLLKIVRQKLAGH